MDIQQIDSAILSVVKEQWMKVAMVIFRVADGLSSGSSPSDQQYEAVSHRIQSLVQDGRLEAQGDIRNWRASEIRLKSK
jgi:Protein of unknown function